MTEIKNNIIIGIPAYNESKNIGSIIKKAKLFCNNIIVCDDGSIDDTANVAKKYGAIVVSHETNQGYGAALKTLFEFANKEDADLLITLDSDGQHNVGDIPKFINAISKNGSDIVIGSRFLKIEDKKEIPLYRRFGIKTITKLAQATSFDKITDSQSGFRAYNRNALSKIEFYESGMSVSTEILLKAKEKNLTVSEVPINVTYNKNSSTQNPVTHGAGIIGSILQFVSLRHPLLFYGLAGIVLLIIGIGIMSYALDLFSQSRYVSSPLILLSASSTIIGMVLLSTGVILYTLSALLRGKIKEK